MKVVVVIIIIIEDIKTVKAVFRGEEDGTGYDTSLVVCKLIGIINSNPHPNPNYKDKVED